MYAYRGDVNSPRLILNDFSVSDSETSQKGVMGEDIFSEGYPRINIRISTSGSEKGNSLTVRLIRSGKLLKTIFGAIPLNINFKDEFSDPGKKIYYRLDAKDKKGRILVSNPIFVKFHASNSK